MQFWGIQLASKVGTVHSPDILRWLCLCQWINEFTEKSKNQCCALIFFFFLLKCFSFLAPSFLSVTQAGLWSVLLFPSEALQIGSLLLSPSQSSDVPRCEAALGQQETFKMCISDLENATVCMRFEDSCKLSRDCHISIDLCEGFSSISSRRGRDVSSGEKVLVQGDIKTSTDLQIKCEIWIFWDESIFITQSSCLQVKDYFYCCRRNTLKSFSVVVIANCQSESFT